MSGQHLPERVFPLRLAPELSVCSERYVHWLRYLLERLGREAALAAWQQARDHPGDALLDEIVGGDWRADPGAPVDVAARREAALAAAFGRPVEGVALDEARALVEGLPPLPQVRRLADLNVRQEMTTYRSLHLLFHGLALLVEALLDRHGKQGELLAYNALAGWAAANSGGEMGVDEFLALFKTPFDPATRMGAGLDYTLVRATAGEVVLQVQGCAWARYYRQRHPRVGYMLACSMDEANYRAANPRIRMQRTVTLMEDGPGCDFRIYALDE